ncbi:MAG: S41 family peptidase [Firmicutes bacterium]|nr:S41 family peptidase [Bacillota bacterium]
MKKDTTDKTTDDIKNIKKRERTIFISGIFFCLLCLALLFSILTLYWRFSGTNRYFKIAVINNMLNKYYAGDIDQKEVEDGLYYGMVLNSTDRYSTYYSAESYARSKEVTEGNYVGIGIQLSYEDDNMKVASVYSNSPADKAGIKKDDIITKVEGEPVNMDKKTEVVEKIRGKEGTSVVLTVLSGTEEKDVSVTRESIDVPTVAGDMLDKNVGYIILRNFENVTPGQYQQVYESLEKKGMKKLILDLRDNGGGLVTSVTTIADSIIPKGTITYTEDKKGKKEYIESDEKEINIPIIVLVNENTASASEMLSACIQDYNKGKILGVKTYGKGVVQSTYELGDGSALKITTAKYYTPKGICIDGIGISPDIEVENNEDYKLPTLINNVAPYDINEDRQLKRALEEINK